MLLDEINNTVKKLSQLDKKETALQNAEKKAKNDSDYVTITEGFYESVRKIRYAHDELGYRLSDDILTLLDDTLLKLEKTIEAGIVDEDILSSTKQQINRKLNVLLSNEWEDFYSKKTNSVIGKLATIGSLASDKNHIEKIKENISAGKDWESLSEEVSSNSTKIMLFKSSIEEVDKIEEELNLTDEVKYFIAQVTRGRARVTDVTDNILSWIKKEELDDKFTIRFK